jgi:hypothetical protein
MTLRSFLKSHRWAFKAWIKITGFFSSVHWPRTQAVINGGLYYSLAEKDHDALRLMLKTGYYVILTRRKSHLTTYLIALASWLATKRPAYYTHALMNVEGDIDNNIDFKLIEATAPGVHYSTFMQVFDCDAVAVLKPRGETIEHWTLVLDEVKKSYGSAYDNLFDISEANSVSCVEMVYQGLIKLPDYRNRFPNLIKLIEQSNGDLTPQMLYDCGDLEIVFEARR